MQSLSQQLSSACPYSMKAATDNTYLGGCGCVPIKFYLQQQALGQIPSAGMLLEAHLRSQAAPPQAPSPHHTPFFRVIFLCSACHHPTPSLCCFCLPPCHVQAPGAGCGHACLQRGALVLCLLNAGDSCQVHGCLPLGHRKSSSLSKGLLLRATLPTPGRRDTQYIRAWELQC